jgi:hypothetical protein
MKQVESVDAVDPASGGLIWRHEAGEEKDTLRSISA